MPKTKISEFSSTPASNTDIDSINIAEGCAPSGINDAIRELMAQLKDWQSGTSNDPMVIGSSGSLTLSQGTANGVTYLNGSKVLTSGSALTFNGSKLTVSTDSSIGSGGTSASADGDLTLNGTSANGFGAWLAFQSNSSTKGYVGLVKGIVGSGSADNTMGYWANTGLGHRFYVNGAGSGSESMTLDSSGNLGLGVTPSAWGSSYKVLDIGGGASIAGLSNNFYITANAYDNGTNYIYKATAASTLYLSTAGQHRFYNAPSGTAGNAITFTQAMTLTAAGRLGIGVTSPTKMIDVRTSSAGEAALVTMSNDDTSSVTVTSLEFACLGSAKASIAAAVYGDGWLSFRNNNNTEKMRLDSSGRLLVNTTTTVASGDEIAGFIGTAGISAKATGGATRFAGSFWNNATTGDNVFLRFYTEAGGTERGSITYNRAGGLTVYNTTSDYRAKDIYGPVTGSGALIDSTPVYMGKMKGATQERPMFIAHETPDYAHTGEKDAVDEDGNPVYQQMDASALIPVMWAEIQSLRKRLADANL
jgi:hypothetical protein